MRTEVYGILCFHAGTEPHGGSPPIPCDTIEDAVNIRYLGSFEVR